MKLKRTFLSRPKGTASSCSLLCETVKNNQKIKRGIKYGRRFRRQNETL